MSLDPELLKQLIASFSTELTEHTQAITTGLLTLEKNDLNEEEKQKTIAVIFRAAHNIKGTARSLGITDVSEIAHQIENLFALIQKKIISISSNVITVCLEGIDKMHIALQAFIDKKPLPFDLAIFLKKIALDQPSKSTEKIPTPPKNNLAPHIEYESIRVPVTKIDNVSAILEEIQVNKIAIGDHFTALTQLVEKTNEFSDLWKRFANSINNHLLYQTVNDSITEITSATQSMHKNMRLRINELAQLSQSLQEEVSALRMVPIGTLMSTFPRYIRDLAHELNKQVELTIKGDEIKVDKAVLEGIKDPIIHLLRNAVDHGIEDPEDRKLKAKSPTGKIHIDIKEEEGNIIISISDDGAGIDVNMIAEIAATKNYMPQDELQKLSRDEILQFIFHSGFSTKKNISNVSGRGVGLDIVKSNVEDLKGHVSVSSTTNEGTTFILAVPISISSERGLLIKTGEQLFVIPTYAVERILVLGSKDIIEVQGQQALLFDQRTVPLRLLSDILRLKNPTVLEERLPVVILKKGLNAIGLIIDEIVGEREIILKPLSAPLTKVPCVAGGTLLESNQVVMVLEIDGVINTALGNNKISRINFQTNKNIPTEKPHILVVDDSITTRTLEKNVLESKNYQVTVAVNGKEAWDLLQKQNFSLIITDVTMPLMDGFTLTEHIKQSDKHRQLPVIIVTSLGSDAEKKRGMEVGADAYIIKNEFESGALLDIVSQFL